MKRLLSACVLLSGMAWLPAGAYATNCAGLPTQFTGNEFPTGNFFTNFNNNCYLIPFAIGNGSGKEQGDTNSIYNKLYFNINPALAPYQLIVVGVFPNSRYFSLSVYDNHSAFTQGISDVNIVPLTANNINPYEPGVAYVSGQHYAVPINLGGTPGTLEKGCMMNGFNVAVNGLDATQRHAYMNWNLDVPFLQQNTLPTHEVDTPGHTNPNKAGTILIRTYLDLTNLSAANQPHVIVRDVASGCAYPAAYVTGTMNVVSTNSSVGNTWLNQQQVQEHNVYANWQSTQCWGYDPYSKIQWLRGDEYVPGANPDAAYTYAYVPTGLTQTLFNAGEVMRLRFRVPTTPPTPCTNGCSRSGNEQIRYVSVSFEATGGVTLASIPDTCPLNTLTPCIPMVQDANGYVTLVLGMGEPQPSWVTPATGYTWLDLSTNANFSTFNLIAMRNILPASSFNCDGRFAPFKVGEATDTAGGNLMGLYVPVIDYPVATTLPQQASPITGPTACATYPIGPPAAISSTSQKCSVLLPPPITISTLTTQCATPGCNQVVAQAKPPISILGNGFGSFPLGLPYTGTSNFLEIRDVTQNWSAGFTGDSCTLNIGEWSGSLISVIANVNQNGACPLVAGDQLSVTVTNPQTLSRTSFAVTVAAQTAGLQTR